MKFVRNAFIQRRKTFANNICNAYSKKKQEIEDVLCEMGYDKSIRSETLKLEEFVSIYKRIFE